MSSKVRVAWLSDRTWAYVGLEGPSFGDVPLSADAVAGYAVETFIAGSERPTAFPVVVLP
jgi:hypothetical protein